MASTRIAAIGLACLSLALVTSSCTTTAPQPTQLVSSDGVEIRAILTEVQKALDASAAELKDDSLPPLDSVTLTLQASVARELGGKVNVLIVAFGASVQAETTQELVLTLAPPKPPKAIAPPLPTFSEQLVQAIVGGVRGVKSASHGHPPLELQSLEATVSFTVEKSATVGGSFTIQPVTVGLSGDMKNKAVQKLRLAFKSKK